jgi:protein-S-isoprenylcysteine O-methyltransferase Ste14
VQFFHGKAPFIVAQGKAPVHCPACRPNFLRSIHWNPPYCFLVRPLSDYLHPALWLAWIIYWKIAALDVKPAARRDGAGHRWLYFLPVIAAFTCFWLPLWMPSWRAPIFLPHEAPFIIGTLLLVAGLLFAVWARIVLGRNWSNVVTVKVGHELIQRGPYRWVRHPIYTGILLAIAGSALAQDLMTDLPIVPLAFLGFWIKLRREESWMREEFGASYDAYSERSARLIPFLF